MSMDKPTFVRRVDLEVQTLDAWIEQRWLRPEPTPEGESFSERDVARARLIANLRDGFGVNDEGVDIVLHLLDQIHGMRVTLAELREGMTQAER